MDLHQRKWLSVFLALSLGCGALEAQDNQKFQLVVLRSEAQNNIKKGRATKAVVEVRDENNKPVAGVILTFTLPREGASGVFTGGGQVTTVSTDGLGQASVTYQPNSVPGQFNIQVTGNHQGQSLTTGIAQANVATAAAVSATTIGIIVGVIAAAGVGLGVGLTRGGNDSTSNGGGAGGVRITPGTPVVTPPR